MHLIFIFYLNYNPKTELSDYQIIIDIKISKRWEKKVNDSHVRII